MKCPTRESLSEYADGEVSPDSAVLIGRHLEACVHCDRRLRLLRLLKRRLRELPMPAFPADLGESLEEAWPAPAFTHARGLGTGRSWPIAVALVMAGFAFWQWQRRSDSQIPSELLVAQHLRFSAGLPLSQAERIVPEFPFHDP